MIINYTYGFKFDDILYGWKPNEKLRLFRLPQMIDKRFYPLKEIPIIDVGKGKGFLVSRKRKSVNQLKDMTVFINFKHQEISGKDCPF